MEAITSTRKNCLLLGSDILDSSIFIESRAQRKRLNYMPFGYCKDHTESRTGFTGRLKESLFGQYLLGNGYRGYSPTLLRFSAADDASPFGAGGINTYAYCLGSPVNCTDDSGHFSLLKIFTRTPKVRLKIGVLTENFEDLPRLIPNPYRPNRVQAQFFTYSTEIKKVKQGTLLVYKGKSIKSADVAIERLDHAYKHNAKIIRKFSEYDTNRVRSNLEPIAKKREWFKQGLPPTYDDLFLPSYHESLMAQKHGK
jgi:RHS repeat-associated protein